MRTRLENCFLEYVAAGTVLTPEQLRRTIEPVAQEPAPVVAAVAKVEVPAAPARPTLLAAFEQWNEHQHGRFSSAT